MAIIFFTMLNSSSIYIHLLRHVAVCVLVRCLWWCHQCTISFWCTRYAGAMAAVGAHDTEVQWQLFRTWYAGAVAAVGAHVTQVQGVGRSWCKRYAGAVSVVTAGTRVTELQWWWQLLVHTSRRCSVGGSC